MGKGLIPGFTGNREQQIEKLSKDIREYAEQNAEDFKQPPWWRNEQIECLTRTKRRTIMNALRG